MTELRTVSTGDPGLDLVLGGGLIVLRRAHEESGSLLIRGGAGAGKTVLALQLATKLAESLEGHVAYGCVELLPMELAAQQKSLWPEATRAPVIVADIGSSHPFSGVQPAVAAALHVASAIAVDAAPVREIRPGPDLSSRVRKACSSRALEDT